MSLKILPKKEIRSYELTMLLPASLTSDEMTTILGELREILKKNKIAITSEADWGRKNLAYTVKRQGVRHTEANYQHWVVSTAPKQIAKCEFELHNFPRIIRHLLVLAEEVQAAPAEQKETVEAAK
ncbi:MAG: 30S ribosomal protein S6 [bacterium]|nr:30S ribosomal protein S6 [bacterium]